MDHVANRDYFEKKLDIKVKKLNKDMKDNLYLRTITFTHRIDGKLIDETYIKIFTTTTKKTLLRKFKKFMKEIII